MDYTVKEVDVEMWYPLIFYYTTIIMWQHSVIRSMTLKRVYDNYGHTAT